VVVPLVDEQDAGRVYDRSMLHLALIGAVLAGLLFGALAWALATGSWSVSGLGQFAAAGTAPATFTGAGVGAALGGLAGALVALYRIPRAQAAAGQGKATKPGPDGSA
jgi:hypothetical protein